MVNAVHAVLYTQHPEEVRAFFRDVLNFPAVDAGHGWLIFALPPAEMGVHPTQSPSEDGKHQLFLICDDLQATMEELKRKGVEFTQPVQDAGSGLLTALKLPGGGENSTSTSRSTRPRWARDGYDFQKVRVELPVVVRFRPPQDQDDFIIRLKDVSNPSGPYGDVSTCGRDPQFGFHISLNFVF